MSNPFTALDHVQLAMPKGEEAAARRFYCDVLGMSEIVKAPILAKRGGCWFQSGDVQIHLGVEAEFRPAKKAHPALRCENYSAFIAWLQNRALRSHPTTPSPALSVATFTMFSATVLNSSKASFR